MTMTHSARSKITERGSILIIALWALFLLTTFAIRIGLIVRQKITLAKRLDTRDKLLLIAEAGIKTAIMELRIDDVLPEADVFYEAWGNHMESFKDVAVGDGYFRVGYDDSEDGAKETHFGVMDEGSKINLNVADAETLSKVLQVGAGLDSEESDRLAYAIIDWRDADSFYQHPEYGAEDDDYKHSQTPYEAKDAPYETVDELILIMGMDAAIYARLTDLITVYGSGKININTASRTTLNVLGLSDKVVQDILDFRRGEDKIEGNVDDHVFTVPSEIILKLGQFTVVESNDQSRLNLLIDRGQISTTTDFFRIQSRAGIKARTQEAEITAVVNRQGHVQYWREKFL